MTFFLGIEAVFYKGLCDCPFVDHWNCVEPIYQFYWSSPLLVNVCWLFLVTHLMLLPIAVEFGLGHHPVMPAIPCLHILWSTRACTVFHIEIATFKLPKPCLTCSNRWSIFTTSKRWLSTDFFFWLNKKSNVRCKCSFSGTHVDMITQRYNTDAIIYIYIYYFALLCVLFSLHFARTLLNLLEF